MLFLYAVRSLFVRRGATALGMFVIAAIIASITIILGIAGGLRSVIEDAPRPQNAIVATIGVVQDHQSHIPFNAVERIAVSPGVATVNAKAMVSPEFITSAPFKRADGELDDVRIRGVDAIAFQVHPVDVSRGQLPRPGEREVLVGLGLLERYDGFTENGMIRIGHHQWRVSGVIAAKGRSYESEIWCDRGMLTDELRKRSHSVVYVALESPSMHRGFADAISKARDLELEALPEHEFNKRHLKRASAFLRVTMILVLVLCASAVFAGTNTMHSLFLGQMRELGTLMAIGFTKRRIAGLVLLQSFILSLVGGAVGLLIALFANGKALAFHELMVVYVIEISGSVLGVGVLAALTIGAVGCAFAVLQTYRLRVLAILRD